MKLNTFITLRLILIFSSCISLSSLSGCGQTGPLYMPKKTLASTTIPAVHTSKQAHNKTQHSS